MGTIEILTKLKRKIMENPATAKSVPVEDIIKAVYTEAYGLRQLYSEKRFEEVEKKIMQEMYQLVDLVGMNLLILQKKKGMKKNLL